MLAEMARMSVSMTVPRVTGVWMKVSGSVWIWTIAVAVAAVAVVVVDVAVDVFTMVVRVVWGGTVALELRTCLLGVLASHSMLVMVWKEPNTAS